MADMIALDLLAAGVLGAFAFALWVAGGGPRIERQIRAARERQREQHEFRRRIAQDYIRRGRDGRPR